MNDITLLSALGLIGYLLLGLGIGAAYFAAMWRSATLFTAGGRASLGIALVAGRFALILASLTLIATRAGALPLLATALGITIARGIALRRVKAMPA